MHVRWSSVRGITVFDDDLQADIGWCTDPLINPDTGRILGFFVHVPFSNEDHLFLACNDIVSWGNRVHVRSADVLCPAEDIVRLKAHLADRRSFLGQQMKVKGSARTIGRCSDIQFDTKTLQIEWIFPRRFLWSLRPIARQEIDSVTKTAIWIREPLLPVRETTRPEPIDVPTGIVTDTPAQA